MIAHHITFGAYGFWLPNDPRGSGSLAVGSLALRKFGPATKVATRHSVAHVSHDHRLRLAAKAALKHPPVLFSAKQILQIADGFTTAANELDLAVYACAIMPDHVHLVTGVHERPMKKVVTQMKSNATMALGWTALCEKEKLVSWGANSPANRDRRLRSPSPWAAKHWDVFIDTEEQLFATARYVEGNPVKDGLPAQRWGFVVPIR